MEQVMRKRQVDDRLRICIKKGLDKLEGRLKKELKEIKANIIGSSA